MHTIPVQTQAAIKAAVELGALVIIATGREYATTQKFVYGLDLTTPIICFQGALIYAPTTGETIAGDGLSLPPAHQLIDLARAHKLALSLYIDDQAYAEYLTAHSRAFYNEIGATLTEVIDLKLATDKSPITIAWPSDGFLQRPFRSVCKMWLSAFSAYSPGKCIADNTSGNASALYPLQKVGAHPCGRPGAGAKPAPTLTYGEDTLLSLFDIFSLTSRTPLSCSGYLFENANPLLCRQQRKG